MRVLEWIIGRCHGHKDAREKSIGWVPRFEDMNLQGLVGMNREWFDEMMKIDPEEWRRELVLQNELFLKLYHELPKEMIYQRELLVARL
jgi:phosphoenolpyruvate carboxykinase (GTP)